MTTYFGKSGTVTIQGKPSAAPIKVIDWEASTSFKQPDVTIKGIRFDFSRARYILQRIANRNTRKAKRHRHGPTLGYLLRLNRELAFPEETLLFKNPRFELYQSMRMISRNQREGKPRFWRLGVNE